MIDGVMPTVVNTLGCRAPVVFAPDYKLITSSKTPPTFTTVQRQALTSYQALRRRGFRVEWSRWVATLPVADSRLPLMVAWYSSSPLTSRCLSASAALVAFTVGGSRPHHAQRGPQRDGHDIDHLGEAHSGCVPARCARCRRTPGPDPYGYGPPLSGTCVLHQCTFLCGCSPGYRRPCSSGASLKTLTRVQIMRLHARLRMAGVAVSTFVGLNDVHVFPAFYNQSRQAADACAAIADLS